MVYDQLKRTWKDVNETARRIKNSLSQLYAETKGHSTLRRMGLCCIFLLAVLAVSNPLLGITCLLGVTLYLSK